MVVVVAAGNEQRGSAAYVADSTSPARAAGAVTTAAAGSDLIVAPFSNWGVCVDASALGVAVECADPDLVPGFWNGTSMATPHLCAVLALLAARATNAAAAKKALYAAADDTPEPVEQEGHGFARADLALAKLADGGSYFPALPRRPKSSIDNVPLAELKDFVMTYRREDIGRFERKRG